MARGRIIQFLSMLAFLNTLRCGGKQRTDRSDDS